MLCSMENQGDESEKERERERKRDVKATKWTMDELGVVPMTSSLAYKISNPLPPAPKVINCHDLAYPLPPMTSILLHKGEKLCSAVIIWLTP